MNATRDGVPGYISVDPEGQNFYALTSVSGGQAHWPHVDGGMNAIVGR